MTPHSPNTTLDSLDKSRPASTGLYGRNISSPAPGFNSSGASDGGKSTPGVYDERTSTPAWTTVNAATINANGSSRKDHNLLQSHQQQRHPLTSIYASSPITGVSSPNNMTSSPDISFPNNYVIANDSLNLPDLTSTLGISSDAKTSLLRPRNLAEKARLNSAWLDSSLSLYEQDVKEFDLILLRFKFFSFYDLSPKLDAARINEIYEQARWSILSEEVDCTENEAMMFAALQVQVSKQAKNPDSDVDFLNNKNRRSNDDDIDAALNELQAQLEGNSIHTNGHSHHKKKPLYKSSSASPRPITSDVISIPELSDHLRFSKPRRFTLKTTKKLYFVFRDTSLYAYKTREDRFSDPSFVISLRGCEITPDVNLGQLRYAVKLEVPNQEGMTEYSIRFNSEEQYAKWLSAFRLASKGRTMSDTAYENEVRQILDFLSIQQPAPVLAPVVVSSINYSSSSNQEINPEDVVSPKILRRAKSRNYLVHRIMDAHANIRDLSFTEAKLQFIKAWEALPEQGVSLFIVRFLDSKKEVSRKKKVSVKSVR
jgi:kindlin 2